jgi:hypothetical protein
VDEFDPQPDVVDVLEVPEHEQFADRRQLRRANAGIGRQDLGDERAVRDAGDAQQRPPAPVAASRCVLAIEPAVSSSRAVRRSVHGGIMGVTVDANTPSVRMPRRARPAWTPRQPEDRALPVTAQSRTSLSCATLFGASRASLSETRRG